MKIELSTLAQRVEFVADGRKVHPWAKSIGVSKGSIEAVMRMGGSLSSETLSYIHRTENVRIDWLLEGRGHPFAINCAISDDDAAALIEEFLEEQWSITVVSNRTRAAVILEQPGSFEVKDGKDADNVPRMRVVNYRIIEVITGPLGKMAMDLIRHAAEQTKVNLLETTTEILAKIEKGQVGTYRLFDAPAAILAKTEAIGPRDRFFSLFMQHEIFPTSPDEMALLGYYRAMSPANRLAVNQVATAMAEPLKKKS